MFSPCSAKRRASDKDLPVLDQSELMKSNILFNFINDHIFKIPDPDPELGGDVKVGNVKVAVASLCKAVSSDGTLAMAQILMPICYHPAVLASDRELWPRSCHKLKVNPSE